MVIFSTKCVNVKNRQKKNSEVLILSAFQRIVSDSEGNRTPDSSVRG